MEASQIPAGGRQSITVASFSAKFRSKVEIGSFLAVGPKVYLPPMRNCTLYFLKAIVSGKKKRKCAIKFESDSS